MTALRVAWLRFCAMFGGGRAQRELDEEIETHLALLADQHRAEGMSDAAARAAARRAFGGVDRTKEQWHDQRGWPLLDSIIQDVRFAIRLLAKDRRLVLSAVVALGIAVGVNTMVFSFVNTILFRDLPLEHSDELVGFNTLALPTRATGVSLPRAGMSFKDFADVRAAADSFVFIVARAGNVMNVGDDDLAPERCTGGYVSAGAFAMYGLKPLVGRGLGPADDAPGAPAVAVISDRVWATRYHNDPGILRRTTRVNGVPSAIVGVMPSTAHTPLMRDDLWQPLQMAPGLQAAARDVRTLSVDGRLKPDVSLPRAQAELDAIMSRLARDYPETDKDIRLTIQSLSDVYRGGDGTAPILIAMLVSVGIVLFIACANVANLLLARSLDRSREIAIRASLGASRLRLVRQLFIESLVLGCAGGLLGFLLSIYFVKIFSVAFQGKEVGGTETFTPYWVNLSPDWRVFSYLAALCLTTAVVFGFAPAVHLLKTRLQDALRDGGRGVGTGLRARRWTQLLMVGELALALVLLVSAGLMTRSAVELHRRGEVFDTADLMTMRFTLPPQVYPTVSDRHAFIERVENRLAANPAMVSASITSNLPFIPGGARRDISHDARPGVGDEATASALYLYVDPQYFRTLGVPLLRGRGFTALDAAAGQDSVIINQEFAVTFFPDADPLGQRIYLRDSTRRGAAPLPATIVGISPTIQQSSIPGKPNHLPEAVVYAPLQRDGTSSATLALIVRDRGDAAAVVDRVREELRALDPDLPLYFVRSMTDAASEMEFQVQGMLTLFGFFAAVAFVLAAVGLYGVTSHAVTQRTAEIGVRMALGAQHGTVLWLFLRRTLVQVAIGLVLGLGAAFAVGRVLESALVQTNARDPLTFACVSALLVLVSCAAALIPARRAAGLDPAVTLRHE